MKKITQTIKCGEKFDFLHRTFCLNQSVNQLKQNINTQIELIIFKLLLASLVCGVEPNT